MNRSIFLEIKNKLDNKHASLYDKFLKEVSGKESDVKSFKSKIDFKCSTCNKLFSCTVFDWIRRNHFKKCRHYTRFFSRKMKVKESIVDKIPNIVNEWSELNNIDIKEINFCSPKKYWWNCLECKSNYSQSMRHRYEGAGCPFCAGKKVNETNSLFHIRPDVAKCVIDPDPKTISYCSSKKCKINCIKCRKESFSSPLSLCKSFDVGRTGCKYCANKIVNEDNNLKITHPELCLEWSDKNEFGPENYTAAKTRVKFWWKCKDCFYEWKSEICCRTGGARGKSNKSGCPHCAFKISKKEQLWLDSLNIPKENRQISLNIGEKFFKLDALVGDIVYEFNGDYWHGNPKYYNSNEINKVSKRTFGDLYECTTKKKKILEDAGYEVVSMWESDFNNLR